jgi:hypothetical protein
MTARSCFAVLAFLGLSMQCVWAQPRYRVEVEQKVIARQLVLDFFITRLRGDTIWLAASNFSVFANKEALDLSLAEVDHSADGRWDNNFDSPGYNDVSVGKSVDFVTFNINCKSQFKSLNPGRGQPVLLRRERIGRVKIPITDACAPSGISWRLDPIAIMEWSSKRIKQEGEFVPAVDDFILCEAPAKPTITPLTPLATCATTPVVLQTNATSTIQWFRNGAAIPGATATQLTVTKSGSYTVQQTECVCPSPRSDSVLVEITPAGAPDIWYGTDGKLHTNLTQDIQWYRNGKVIPGATASSVALDAEGTYWVVLSNSCGLFKSAEFVWSTARADRNPWDLDAAAPSLVVHPNPYVASTQLSYHLPYDCEVTIELTLATGTVVKSLLHEQQRAGKYSLRFAGRDHGLNPGTYFLRFSAGDVRKTFKVVEVQ